MRVLPADVYDTLELSALAYGGIGAHRSFENLDARDLPCCVLGHAEAATDRHYESFPDVLLHPICIAIKAAGIWSNENDNAVDAIIRRKNLPRYGRVSFRDWCAELGVVRGE